MIPELDLVMPVWQEGENIQRVFEALRRHVKTPFRVLVCYDREDDDTLRVLRAQATPGVWWVPVKNRGQGAFGAVRSGFEASTAAAVLVWPADDDYNPPRIEEMVQRWREGCDVVAASRFMSGGRMERCPWLKAILLRLSAFVLHHVARVPTRDASNGLRLFSRRVIEEIPIESSVGFTYSIELLVKCHRLGWKIGEVPAYWFERTNGRSRFRVLRWLPAYLRWFLYAFATTFLLRGPRTVRLRTAAVRELSA